MRRDVLTVGGGLVVSGLGSYVFLTLAARSLPPDSYSVLASFWALVMFLGLGFFFPLEVELARAIPAAAATGGDRLRVQRWGLRAGAVLTALVLGVSALLSPMFLDRLFRGDAAMLAALPVAVVGFFGLYVTWGTVAGRLEFGRYALLLTIQGVCMSAAAAVLWAAGVGAAAAFAVLVGSANLAAVVFTYPWASLRGTPTTPGGGDRALARGVAKLTAASLLSQLLLNAGPLAVQYLATEAEAAAAGAFLAGLVLARVPMFLYTSVQASVLPRFTILASEGRRAGFLRLLGTLVGTVVAVGSVATILGGLFGPSVLQFVFGSEFVLSGVEFVYLVGGSVAYILATTLQQALVATGAQGRVVPAWGTGCLVFVLAALPAGALVTRIGRGYLAGMCAAALAMGILTAVRLASGREVGADADTLASLEAEIPVEP